MYVCTVMSKYADVALPVPLDKFFTYAVPPSLKQTVRPGVRVYVPFGKTRRLTAVVVKTHDDRPDGYEIKSILEMLDEERPSILKIQLELLEWISKYCLCSPGDVMKAALPSGLRPDNTANSRPYKPKTERFVRLGAKAVTNGKVMPEELFDNRQTAQKELFLKYLELAGYDEGKTDPQPVTRRYLASFNRSSSVMNSLLEKGLLDSFEVETGRLPVFSGTTRPPLKLSSVQQDALDKIRSAFLKKNVCLLHGVTSSGKTEIYIHLIKEQLEKGKQVLYMLPEIALTTQIMHRLQNVFGNEMCVYHSKCPDNLRVEIWNRQTGPEPYGLVLGARSAVMLPFSNLGLVIVDEEHDSSFKQEDPAPRYHGRNTAIMLASLCGAKTLLGSATPSLESYANAVSGKYGLVTIAERFKKTEPPVIEIVNTAELRRKKYMKGIMSPPLIERISKALEKRKQVILFQNRRGYTGTVECPDCGWVQKCDCCDVSLTFHKNRGEAACHYCGRRYSLPPACPSCGGKEFRGRGYGTERVEESIKNLFPQARTARLDLDSAKSGYETILTDFQEQKTDILIGTQMVSKGLDFNNVSVVGILQADSIISYPDFRATERAYQLMVQVAGRAGRKDSEGVVIIQTKQTDSMVLKMVESGNWDDFFNNLMQERQLFNYPPFSRLMAVFVKSKTAEKAERAAQEIAKRLARLFGHERVLGPDAPLISRIQSMHIRKILVKYPLDMPINLSRKKFMQAASETEAIKGLMNGVVLSFDADPQ